MFLIVLLCIFLELQSAAERLLLRNLRSINFCNNNNNNNNNNNKTGLSENVENQECKNAVSRV